MTSATVFLRVSVTPAVRNYKIALGKYRKCTVSGKIRNMMFPTLLLDFKFVDSLNPHFLRNYIDVTAILERIVRGVRRRDEQVSRW